MNIKWESTIKYMVPVIVSPMNESKFYKKEYDIRNNSKDQLNVLKLKMEVFFL